MMQLIKLFKNLVGNFNKPYVIKNMLIILICLISFSLYGQNENPTESSADTTTHILGIGFKNKSNFSFLFKIPRDNYKIRFDAFTLEGFWKKGRDNTIFSGLDTVPVIHRWDRHINLGLILGVEKNFPLLKDLRFIHGPFVSGNFYYEYSKSYYGFSPEEFFDFQLGIGYMIGINYFINNHFGLSADLMPRLIYRRKRNFYQDREDGPYKPSKLKFRIKNTAKISILYHF
ncbi:MAG: hypothetical protein V5A47_13465 [Bacteroidales bacterium]